MVTMQKCVLLPPFFYRSLIGAPRALGMKRPKAAQIASSANQYLEQKTYFDQCTLITEAQT